MKNLLPFVCFIMLILLVVFSSSVTEAATTGINLFFSAVLPALFPFFVLATLIERTGALDNLAILVSPISRRLSLSRFAIPVLFLGACAGYPSGARLSGMLQDSNAIDDKEASNLGTIANIASPMFIALCSSMLGKDSFFAPLLLSHYSSALFIFIVFRFTHHRKVIALRKYSKPTRIHASFARALPESIADGIIALIKVGGSIIFFLVLSELLSILGVMHILSMPFSLLGSDMQSAAPAFLTGILEMTGGIFALSKTNLPPRLMCSLIAFLLSFGGLSVLVQAMTFLKFDRPIAYITTKLLQGAFAFAFVYLLFPFFGGSVQSSVVLSPSHLQNAYDGISMLLASALSITVPLILSHAISRSRKH